MGIKTQIDEIGTCRHWSVIVAASCSLDDVSDCSQPVEYRLLIDREGMVLRILSAFTACTVLRTDIALERQV